MRTKSVTVKQAAAALEVHERTVTGWRAGDRGPSIVEAGKLAALLDRPELLGWWDWPPGSEQTVPPASADTPGRQDHPGSGNDRGEASESPPRSQRRALRWAGLAVVCALLIGGLAVTLAFALRPPSRSAAVEEDAKTSVAQTSPGDRLNSGPTIAIDDLSCNRPVRIPTAATTEETQGTLGATTFTNPAQTCGAGPKIAPGLTVQVACRLSAPQMSSVNPDGYWYLIASGVNRGRFAAANTFLNGDPPGAGNLTNTDVAVPRCVLR